MSKSITGLSKDARTRRTRSDGRPAQKAMHIRRIVSPGVFVLLLPAAMMAQTTPFTATGWINGVQSPGIICTNALGQVFVRGNVHTARVQATDARVTGQVLILTDGGYHADGTTSVQGMSYLQVGTWDAAGTNFTPTGGLWEWSWNGVMQTDNSLQLKLVGYGSGGTIDGLRTEQTVTRAKASSPVDPTVPYLYSGTIKPPPLNTIEVVDDFSQPFTYPQFGSGTCYNSDGQFHAVGDFPVATDSFDTFLLGQQGGTDVGWSVANDTTREWRAALVSLDDNATNMAQLTVSAKYAPGYGFLKGRDFACLMKWSLKGDLYSVLWCERTPAPLPHTNVVLAVALTRQQSNLVITARVLDKADPDHVLFAHTYVDTPGSDPSLTGDEFQALTGMHISGLFPDVAEPPPAAQVGVLLGLFQYTDGQQPAPTAVFENLELRTSEIPFISIEPAVRLSWPASAAINYAVEGAPSAEGPWLPVQEQAIPGLKTMTMPAQDAAQFFRLVQKP